MEPTMWSPQEFVHTNLPFYFYIILCKSHISYPCKKGLLLNFNSHVKEPPWKLVLETSDKVKRGIFISMKTGNQGRFSECIPLFPPCDHVTAFSRLLGHLRLRQLLPLRALSVSWKTLTTNSSLKRKQRGDTYRRPPPKENAGECHE